MAITKITAPSEVPASTADWTAVLNYLRALLVASQGAERVVGSNITQGSVFFVGGAVYMADADTAITGSASDYVKLTVSKDGLTLAPSYVANISAVAWSDQYHGYYDEDGNLYVFDILKALAAGATSVKTLAAVPLKNIDVDWSLIMINPPGDNWVTALYQALATGWTNALNTALGTNWVQKLARAANTPYGVIPDTTIADNRIDRYYFTNTATVTKTAAEYTKAKSFLCPLTGTVSVTWYVGCQTGYSGYGRLYKNGVAYSAEISAESGVTTVTNVVVEAGDTIEVWVQNISAPLGVSSIELTIRAQLTDHFGLVTTY